MRNLEGTKRLEQPISNLKDVGPLNPCADVCKCHYIFVYGKQTSTCIAFYNLIDQSELTLYAAH